MVSKYRKKLSLSPHLISPSTTSLKQNHMYHVNNNNNNNNLSLHLLHLFPHIPHLLPPPPPRPLPLHNLPPHHRLRRQLHPAPAFIFHPIDSKPNTLLAVRNPDMVFLLHVRRACPGASTCGPEMVFVDGRLGSYGGVDRVDGV